MQDLEFTTVKSPSAIDTNDELPVNNYSHWKSVSLQWTGLFYCVLWLRGDI